MAAVLVVVSSTMRKPESTCRFSCCVREVCKFSQMTSSGSGAMRIESKVEGFHDIATLVLQSAISQGRTISLATYDNATALELDVRLRTEMIDRPV